MARDLSVQAILTANTTPFANGMKSATAAAKKFSSDMKRIRQEINQPLFVPRPGGGKQTPEMVMFGGTISEGLAAQRFRSIQRTERLALVARQQAISEERKQHSDRFQMIRQREERALKLRQFYARKEAELERSRGSFRITPGIKKAFGAFGLGAGLAGDVFGADSGTGRVLSGVGNIAGQAALGGAVGGPWAAAVFGGVAALKEFKEAINASKEAVKQETAARLAGRTRRIAEAGTLIEEIEGMRRQLVPDRPKTPHMIREELVHRLQRARNAEAGQVTETGKAAAEAITRAAERELAKVEQHMFFRGARNVLGLSGRNALQGITSAFGDLAGIARIHEPILLRARFGVGRFIDQTQQNMAAQMEHEAMIAQRVMTMSGRGGPSMGAPLALRGTNTYLEAIHDQPKAEKSLADLVKLAKEQLAEEKKQASEIAREINRQRVTVKM